MNKRTMEDIEKDVSWKAGKPMLFFSGLCAFTSFILLLIEISKKVIL